MDTELKKYRTPKWLKVLAFCLALLSVGMIVLQVCGAFKKLDETNNFDIIENVLMSFTGENSRKKVEENTLSNTFTDDYVTDLGNLLVNYGDGTKEDYEKLASNAKTESAALYEVYKSSLIKYFNGERSDFSDYYLSAIFKYADLTENLGVYADGENQYYNFESDYGEAVYDLPFDEFSEAVTLPQGYEKNITKTDYDGIIALPNIENIDTGTKIESGYYTYKINEAALKENLNKYGILFNGFDVSGNLYISLEDFQQEYKRLKNELDKKYKNASYFIRTPDGRVFTNTDLSKDITYNEIYNTASKSGFYVLREKYSVSSCDKYWSRNGVSPDLYFSNESRYLSNSEYEDYYYNDPDGYIGGIPTTVTKPAVIEDETENSGDETYATTYADTYATTFVYTYGTTNSQVETVSGNKAGKTASTFVDLEGNTEYYFFVDTSFTGGEDAFTKAIDDVYTTRELLKDSLIICLIFFVIFIACLVILILGAGRKNGESGVHLLKTDRIFTDLRFIINGSLIGGVIAIFMCLMMYIDVLDFDYSVLITLASIVSVVSAVAITALVLDYLLFAARHIKNNSFIKNIFIVWLFKKGPEKIREKAENIGQKYDFVKDVAKSMLVKGIIFFVLNGIFALAAYIEIYNNSTILIALLMAAADIVCFALFIRYLYNLGVIIKNLELLRQGNMNVYIDTGKMPLSLKKCADNVINIRDGLKSAVNEAVKQEQTKTELITNVSHDLKTPLTSIINYVELLKNCNITDETAKEYLDVLGEKSDRLKKLIEDLVEASKASTGNIKVNLIDVSLNEILNQLLGEHSDSLEKKKLNIVAEIPEENIVVRADGKLLYRVFENLVVNIEKYSLYGTRVYVTLKNEGGKAYVIFKNISEMPLNISAEELKARFVRGDSSRSTEGNGLGLSIAENLCNVQGAKLQISISGDLFIATVVF